MLKLFCKSCSVGSFSNHRHLLDLIKKQGTPKWHLANLDIDWSVNNRLPYAFGTESQISSFCFIKVLCHKMWGTWYWCTKGHYYCDRISSFIESTHCGCTELNLSINLHTHILVSVNGRLHANHQGWALRANLASIRKSYWLLQCSFGCVCACVSVWDRPRHYLWLIWPGTLLQMCMIVHIESHECLHINIDITWLYINYLSSSKNNFTHSEANKEGRKYFFNDIFILIKLVN